jgi:hypothetical protein
MRKISRNYRLRGNLCRAFFAAMVHLASAGLLMFYANTAVYGEILLPPPPTAMPPPRQPATRNPTQDVEVDRSDTIQGLRQEFDTTPPPQNAKSNPEKKVAKLPKKRLMAGVFELSLLKPWVTTTGHRRNYTCDVGSHASGYMRPLVHKDPMTVQFWVGLRVAPFGCVGSHKSQRGRFSHTFLGPAVGFGRFIASEDPSRDQVARSFWLWSFGISGLHKTAAEQDVKGSTSSDFSKSRLVYESPAGWAEFRWSQVFRGALGSGLLLGTQTASGKSFYYVGLTASGFY